MSAPSSSCNINDKSCCSPAETSAAFDSRSHWDKVYSKAEYTRLGWFEDISRPSLDLIARCNLSRDAKIIDAGSGASTLIGSLVDQGYTGIMAVDISEVALDIARANLGGRAGSVQFIAADVTGSEFPVEAGSIDLWHDRAVMHFLLEEGDRNKYVQTLKKVVKHNGFVIIAAFSLEGAKKCSGLDIRNYDADMIAGLLGNEFALIESFPYEYTMPSGEKRPYIYTRFQRK